MYSDALWDLQGNFKCVGKIPDLLANWLKLKKITKKNNCQKCKLSHYHLLWSERKDKSNVSLSPDISKVLIQNQILLKLTPPCKCIYHHWRTRWCSSWSHHTTPHHTFHSPERCFTSWLCILLCVHPSARTARRNMMGCDLREERWEKGPPLESRRVIKCAPT